jgi:hypothetical protein
MFGVSSSTIPSILSFATGLFGDLFPFVALILGIVLFFWVFEMALGWLRNIIEIRQENKINFESGIIRSLKALRIKAPRFEMIHKAAQKSPEIAKAIELHQKFKDLMAEK